MPNVRILADPFRIAADEGRKVGAREERERIKSQFAAWATRHPDPVVSDELWAFVNKIGRDNS